MPTNEERREVAARLWKHIGKPLFTGQDVEDIIGVQRSDFDAVLADASYRRLADLMEPEERTCRIYDTDHEFEDSIRCDACQMTFRRPWQPFKFCPNCGAKVVSE